MDGLPYEQVHSGSIKHIDKHDFNNHDEDVKMLDNGIAAITVNESQETTCCCFSNPTKVVSGLVIVLLISISWTGTTQLGKSAYSPYFQAPFFTTWFTTCFMVVAYPVFMISLLCKKSAFRLRTFLRESSSIFGDQGFCIQRLFIYIYRYSLPFCFLWLLTNYFYFRSLETLLPGTTTAVFSSSSCFVYILSLLILKDKFYFLRITSVCLSVGGITIMCYTLGFGNPDTLGVVFVTAAAFGSALYQVLFKFVMGSPTGGQVALFLTLLGSVNLFLYWPISLVLDYFRYENFIWDSVPWSYLAGTGVLAVVFNFLVNFGISITYPLFIAVGTMLGVPLSAVVDRIFRDGSFGVYKVLAVVLILTGFLFMLISNKKLDRYERRLRCQPNKIDES